MFETADTPGACTAEPKAYVIEDIGLCVLDLPGIADPTLTDEEWIMLLVDGITVARK